MAIRALKAAKIDFELRTYDFTPHGARYNVRRNSELIIRNSGDRPFAA